MTVRDRGGAWRKVALASASLIALVQASAAKELQSPPHSSEQATDRPSARRRRRQPPARVAAKRVRVAIAPGALEPALGKLIAQTGLSLAYMTALTENLATQGVEGSFPPPGGSGPAP